MAEFSGTVHAIPMMGRFNLRIAETDREGAGSAVGVPLGHSIGEINEAGERRSLRLGPDEWWIVAPREEVASIASAFAGSGIVGSLVEITNREVSFALAGPGAEDVLAHGCPRDLSQMAVGRGARTVFSGVDIVLWHFEDRYELDVWRTYAPFTEALLAAATREMAVEV